jgi:hypothetical protein
MDGEMAMISISGEIFTMYSIFRAGPQISLGGVGAAAAKKAVRGEGRKDHVSNISKWISSDATSTLGRVT